MKRIATIQDFSCVGRCSLTVALPVISAAGVECCGIPTALLSNHTGFRSFYIHDLTNSIEPIGAELKRLGIAFDAIYTGYIGSAVQTELISELIDSFRGEDTLVFIDPVMGDNGRLYSGLSEDYPEKMRELCGKADVIMPNLTEACLLLGREYDPENCDYEQLLRELMTLGVKKAVITGAVPPQSAEPMTGAICYDGSQFFSEYTKKENLICCGTGDIFASALVGAVMRGNSFERSVRAAIRFCYEAVRLTAADPQRREYGVNFEQALPLYIKLLEE